MSWRRLTKKDLIKAVLNLHFREMTLCLASALHGLDDGIWRTLLYPDRQNFIAQSEMDSAKYRRRFGAE